jgi:hypothetical protein
MDQATVRKNAIKQAQPVLFPADRQTEPASDLKVARGIRWLLSLQAAVADAQAAGKTALGPKEVAGYEAAYTRFIQEGLRANPPPKPTGKRGRHA